MAFVYSHGDRPLEGFTIQRGVGRGGFGEVYFAVSDGGREVALKHLREQAEIELRGVSACMNLKSPNLVSIFDVKRSAQDEYFLVMEYIAGPSLRDLLLANPHGVGTQRAAYIVNQIGKGLTYLHDRGIVHRDLKPGNIFIDEGAVKIGDYGLSKFMSVSRHSGQTASVGTVHYMAPEVGTGNYHRGIDIYALGVILYELIIGRVPYEGSSMGEVLMKHLTAQPEVDNLPAPFAGVIRKALAKDPQDRYATVEEMMDALNQGDVAAAMTAYPVDDLTQLAEQVKLAHPTPASQTVGYARGAATLTAAPGRRVEPVFDEPWPRNTQADHDANRFPQGRQVPAVIPELALDPSHGQVTYAGFRVRLMAWIVDMCVFAAMAAILRMEEVTMAMIICYQGLLVGFWNGQTVGKRALGVKVITRDGTPCSLGRAFGRAFATFLSILTLGIGFLMISSDRRKRSLHDHVAKTLCIRVDD